MAGNRRSGRRRLPTAIKRLRGSTIRHNVSAEPKAPVGIPTMPDFVAADPLAVEEWGQLAEKALKLGVLTIAHGPILGLIATTSANHRRIYQTFAATGYKPVIVQSWKDKDGDERSRIVENPLVRQLRLQETRCTALLGEMGMTPASSSKVQTHGDIEHDEVETFLRDRPTILPFKRARRK
jgi:phage terminase small subunit